MIDEPRGALSRAWGLCDLRELGSLARVKQLAHRLSSPLTSPLRVEKLLHRKHGASRHHVVDRPPDLMGEDRQRFVLPMFLLDLREESPPFGVVTQEKH